MGAIISFFNSLKLGACPYCSLSGKPSGLRACTHPSKGKRKDRALREKERGGAPKAKEGLYKKLQIPTLPQKHPRSGVTFHSMIFFYWCQADLRSSKTVRGGDQIEC